jgi:hypothetical protein
MSALIRESHANEIQPCWVPADSTSGLYPTPTSLIPGGAPIGAGCPISPTPPQVLILNSYPTTAGKYYDIAITGLVSLVGGVSPGADQARIFMSVDPLPIDPPATTGEWADDIRIGGTTDTYFTKFVRLLCNVDAVVSIGIQGFQIGGSTATYSSSWINISVSEVP